MNTLPGELRCSGLSRIMNCLGSLSIQNIIQSETNDQSRDGTAVGELLTHMIRQRTDKPQVKPTAENGVIFDNDMWFYAAQMYHSLLESAQGNEITSEVRIDWPTTSGIIIRGQYDASYVVGDTLYVEDLKYGWRIVDVFKNWQLLGYAIGRYFQLSNTHQINNIVLRIHQPRPTHEDGKVRTWSFSIKELEQYYFEIDNRVKQLASGDKTLSTSKSCKYCEGAAHCPALNRSAYAAIDMVLTDWQDRTLTDKEIAEQLDIISRAEELFEIKAKAIKDLAIHRIQNGGVIQGYSYQMKYGDRKWRDGVSAKSIKMLTGVDIMKTEMMSPAQAEKAGVNKRFVEGLVMKPSKGLDLVKTDLTNKAAETFVRPPNT